MRIRELAEYCESINIECDECEHRNLCEQSLPHMLEDIAPCGLVELVECNKELN